jgi:hypothetical protein
MSRSTSTGSPSRANRSRAAHRSAGRHRIGSATGVRVSDLAVVRERMEFQRPAPRSSFLQRLFEVPAAGRHTWSFLAGSGGRPRSAFAIILSL